MTALEEKDKEIAAEAEDKVERFYWDGYDIGILITLRGGGIIFHFVSFCIHVVCLTTLI